MTQIEIKEILQNAGIDVSSRTIFAILKKNKITGGGVATTPRGARKRMKYRRESKNLTPESKAAYKKVYNEIIEDEEDALFYDEMHASNNILPLYGYSRAGKPCHMVEAKEHKAHSLLFAFSKQGEFFYKVYEGAMNTARCQWFVENLPPIRIVMDNLAIHKCVKMPGAKIFTPVAQPQANPAEIIFSKIKTVFRYINAKNRNMPVSDKLDIAISKLNYDDFTGAINHVKTFVNDNY